MLALMFFIGAIVGIAMGIGITLFCVNQYIGKDVLETKWKKRKEVKNEEHTDTNGNSY